MEANEEKNMQDEIIDSLAKKFTQLENRQQKVEELNLEKLPPKIKELEVLNSNLCCYTFKFVIPNSYYNQ
jgi:hypothetical protein